MTQARRFFPIVDALRAIAVFSVVGYHAGLPFLPGGFVGVDVFFVISGFLIIGHIVEELRAGAFKFSRFYARRALRILPPYLLVIVACMAVAPFILVLPGEYEAFGEEVLWSSGMAANYLFLSQQGYFDAEANTKVLLHLWSLAVEEQFYLVAPILLAILWAGLRRFDRASGLTLLAAISLALFVVSLYGSIEFSDGEPNHAFYQMPFRAWEFIAGGVLSYLLIYARRLPSWILEVALAAGLVLIGWSVATFSHSMPFPSYWAAVPVVGTCVAILAGIALPQGRLSTLFTLKPILFVGLVSYSWYLWHWPMLTFGRVYKFGATDLPFDLAIAGLSFVMAVVTLFLVERPVSRWRVAALSAGWKPTLAGIAASVPIALGGVAFSSVIASATTIYIEEDNGRRPRIDSCIDSVCLEGAEKTGIVLGDSHANASFTTIDGYASERGFALISATSTGCPPLFNLRLLERSEGLQSQCIEAKESAQRAVEEDRLSPEVALLLARWPIYTPADAHRAIITQPGFTLMDPDANEPPEDQRTIFIRKVRETIEQLKAMGVSRIAIVGPVPEFPVDVPTCIARADHYGINRDDHCSLPSSEAEMRTTMAREWIQTAIAGDPAVAFVDPLSAFCHDDGLCRPYDQETGVVLYRDDDHVGPSGADRIYQLNAETFEWLWSGDEPTGVAETTY